MGEWDFNPDEKRKVPMVQGGTCFASGEMNPYGLKMQFYADEKKIFSRLNVAEYMHSWKGMVHGGIVATILDATMFWGAMYFLKCIALTRNATIELSKAAKMNEMPFTAVGEIKSRETNTNAMMRASLYNNTGALCAATTANFTTITSDMARRLELITEDDLIAVNHLFDVF